MTDPRDVEVRRELEAQLRVDIPLIFEDVFSRLRGWGAKKENQRRLETLHTLAPLLKLVLREGERVHVVSRCRLNFAAEMLLMGVWASTINHTVLVSTNQRMLAIHTSDKYVPHLYVNEIPGTSITKLKGSMTVRMGKSSLHIGGIPKHDRKTLTRLFPQNASAQGGLRMLCPSCLHSHERHVAACLSCGVIFRSPTTAALRSALLPGLGDWYLGHRGLAMLEMVGALVSWVIATTLVAGAIRNEEPWLLALAVGLIALTNGFDAALTRWQAKKGLHAADGFLPSTIRGSRGRMAAPELHHPGRSARHPAEQVGVGGVLLWAVFALFVLAGVVAGMLQPPPKQDSGPQSAEVGTSREQP